jgi:histidine triad (HIT) family protein
MVTEEELKNMSPEQIADMQKQNCIFCQIVSGKIPSKKVFEDEKTIAFLDINPASSGHILLIPKTHYAILPQIPEDEVGHLFTIAKNLSNALLKGLGVKGTNIFVANGQVAGQKAPHFMIHIIPRREGDGLNFQPTEIDISKDQIKEIKQKLMPKVRELLGFSVDVSDLNKDPPPVPVQDDQSQLLPVPAQSSQEPEQQPQSEPQEKPQEEQPSEPQGEQQPEPQEEQPKENTNQPADEGNIDIDAIGELFK